MSAQYSFFDEIYVDSFAGGGGASTGIELATGHPVDIAINHDQSAIMMHKRNHPFTEHYREDVWAIDPETVTRGRRVRLAWFSPDCKHFSRAKGAALVDKRIRGLAWVVLRWAGKVKPDVIMLENVPEFVTWGPVRKGKPVKSKAGTTYKKWHKQLEDLGYVIEAKKLCAADYGAPTIRTRFCLIARRDGRPIKFPEPTHAPRDSEAVRSGRLKPWRAAAEIIDWSLPCYSIFESKQEIKEKYGVNTVRPLKPNTLKRIAKGLDKFVIKSAEPFIVPIGYGERKEQAPRVHDIKEPLSTVVSSTKQYVCDPVIFPYISQHKFQNAAQDAKSPLTTVTSVGAHEVVEPKLMPYHMHNHSNARGTDMRDPVNTVTGVGAQMIVEPKVMPYMVSNNSNNAPHGMMQPVPTITTGNRNLLIAPELIQYHAEQSNKEVRGQRCDQPLNTIDASPRYGLAAMHLTQYFSGEGHYHSVEEPLATITTMEREGVTAAYLSKYYTGVDGADVDSPLPTVTAIDHNSITLAHLAHFKGSDKGQHPSQPLMTVTQQDGQFAQIATTVVKRDGRCDLQKWEQVRCLLNEYCEYHLTDDEVLLLNINGAWYFIGDIGLRMLTPRELYDAMGFPHDYIIDRDVDGNPINRADQVARCGNAVCPAVSEAMVRANLPECCTKKMSTMDELRKEMIS